EDFLVAGERGVEHHLTRGLTGGANGNACKDRAVGEREKGFRVDGKHGILQSGGGNVLAPAAGAAQASHPPRAGRYRGRNGAKTWGGEPGRAGVALIAGKPWNYSPVQPLTRQFCSLSGRAGVKANGGG